MLKDDSASAEQVYVVRLHLSADITYPPYKETKKEQDVGSIVILYFLEM